MPPQQNNNIVTDASAAISTGALTKAAKFSSDQSTSTAKSKPPFFNGVSNIAVPAITPERNIDELFKLILAHLQKQKDNEFDLFSALVSMYQSARSTLQKKTQKQPAHHGSINTLLFILPIKEQDLIRALENNSNKISDGFIEKQAGHFLRAYIPELMLAIKHVDPKSFENLEKKFPPYLKLLETQAADSSTTMLQLFFSENNYLHRNAVSEYDQKRKQARLEQKKSRRKKTSLPTWAKIKKALIKLAKKLRPFKKVKFETNIPKFVASQQNTQPLLYNKTKDLAASFKSIDALLSVEKTEESLQHIMAYEDLILGYIKAGRTQNLYHLLDELQLSKTLNFYFYMAVYNIAIDVFIEQQRLLFGALSPKLEQAYQKIKLQEQQFCFEGKYIAPNVLVTQIETQGQTRLIPLIVAAEQGIRGRVIADYPKPLYDFWHESITLLCKAAKAVHLTDPDSFCQKETNISRAAVNPCRTRVAPTPKQKEPQEKLIAKEHLSEAEILAKNNQETKATIKEESTIVVAVAPSAKLSSARQKVTPHHMTRKPKNSAEKKNYYKKFSHIFGFRKSNRASESVKRRSFRKDIYNPANRMRT